MEQGSHEELLKIQDGVYSNLINMQSGREEEEEDVEVETAGLIDDVPGALMLIPFNTFNGLPVKKLN